MWLPFPGHSLSLREVRAETQATAWSRAMRNGACWLAYRHMLSSSFFIKLTPRDGAAHTGRGSLLHHVIR